MESKWKWFPLKYERSRSQIFSINTPAYHHFVSKSLWMLHSLTIEHKTENTAVIITVTDSDISFHFLWQMYLLQVALDKSVCWMVICQLSILYLTALKWHVCSVHYSFALLLHYYACIIPLHNVLFLCTTYVFSIFENDIVPFRARKISMIGSWLAGMYRAYFTIISKV
jgi:hypothetical protein